MPTSPQPPSTIQEIVLVDDEPSVLFALKLLLQALGFSVQDFNGPLEAIQYFASSSRIDLCLCDLKMPKMNGLGVLEEVRKHRPSLPFVLMSAHASTEEIDRAQELGATGFLSKPFTPEDLKQLVEKVAAGQRV
ncbi:MAG: response regulator [Deltaproteobacteria bacterium]|nr:response regulator [Deltaproteobacteria bacterium]